MLSQRKCVQSHEIRNYSKLIICSNEVSNFAKIALEETRYAVIKVKPLTEPCDVDMQNKMIEEIPAFLYWLKEYDSKIKRTSRLYFDSKIYETEALELIKERTQDGLTKEIKDVVFEQFYAQKKPEIKLTRKIIYNLVCDNCKNSYRYITPKHIEEKMHDIANCKTSKSPLNCKYIVNGNELEDKGKPYILKAEEWLSARELIEFNDYLTTDTNIAQTGS